MAEFKTLVDRIQTLEKEIQHLKYSLSICENCGFNKTEQSDEEKDISTKAKSHQ